MEKVKIMVVEDEPIIAADLEYTLSAMDFEVVANVDSGESALETLESLRPDIVLMDIQLAGKLNGIETVRLMRTIAPDVGVIYLSSNTDKHTFEAAQATRPDAFLSKPFRERDIQFSITIAMSKMENSVTEPEIQNEEPNSYILKDRLFVKDHNRMIKIMLDEILWMEADGYYSKIFTREKSYLITKTLKSLESMLLQPYFLRIHRYYIVNLLKIEEFSDLYVYIQKEKIPISKSYKDIFLNSIQKL